MQAVKWTQSWDFCYAYLNGPKLDIECFDYRDNEDNNNDITAEMGINATIIPRQIAVYPR